MTAPDGRVPRGRDPYSVRGECLVGDLERELGELNGLGAHGGDAGFLDQCDHVPQGQHSGDRRGAADEATHAGCRLVGRRHGERVGVSHPALDGLAQFALQSARDVAECRGARTAVEVLVGAADGEVRARPVQGHLDRAGRVAYVPEHQRARPVGGGRDRGHVGSVAGLVGHMTEQRESRTVAETGLDLVERDARSGVRCDPPDRQTPFRGDAFHNEAVGREVFGVGHHLVAPGAGIDRGAGQLVEHHRRRVRHHGLSGGGAEYGTADTVAQFGRRVHPLFVPGPDQAGAPGAVHEGDKALPGGLQRTPEGVAVQVGDESVGLDEPRPVGGERVGEVQGVGLCDQMAGEGCECVVHERFRFSGAVFGSGTGKGGSVADRCAHGVELGEEGQAEGPFQEGDSR